VAAGFEPVLDAFVGNFTERGELGGAVRAVVAGEVAVDVWGGVRDKASGAAWSADTMTLVHSTTKGLSAMVLALLHSRGLLDHDERVATVLARLRPSREGAHHRPPAAGSPGRPVRLRRARRR
jgi:CubicO group peptidase (beta-lactamase class C family)